MSKNMVTIKINNFEIFVRSNISVLEACNLIGIKIPRFCFHEMLSVAGNCRMCLIEVENSEKPVASCVTLVSENLSIFTNSLAVKKARENVIETLLINHPLDCPICDQAGECDLQDQTRTFGNNFSRFQFKKRGVEDKDCSIFIKTIMTRCIHCTRCVRFCNEIAGVPFFTTFNRGVNTEIGNYNSNFFLSEISGNVIDLCPVGALTAKSYSFTDRSWKEEKLVETIDLNDSLGSNMYAKFEGDWHIKTVPKFNSDINNSFISDKARYNLYPEILEIKNRAKEEIHLEKLLCLVDGNVPLDYLLDIRPNQTWSGPEHRVTKTVEIIRKKNIYLSETKDFISKLDKTSGICFIFSSCIKLESTLLNARLRFQYINSEKKFDIHSFSRFINNNIPTNFANLNNKYLISLIEGKTILSFFLFNSKQPSIILGNSLK
jgi:formate hydrogenlyase subunit 6/NADH:ubiquinone oxidoreductase subunit I